MPFTPYHFGPALLLGMLFFPHMDLAAIMLSSVIIDVEPMYVIYARAALPLHGPLHTYLGATFMAVVSAGLVRPFRRPLSRITSRFGFQQQSSFARMVGTSLIGTYSHIFLDSFLYPEMNPFLPLPGNPFLGLLSAGVIYGFCILSFIIGGCLLFSRSLRQSDRGMAD